MMKISYALITPMGLVDLLVYLQEKLKSNA